MRLWTFAFSADGSKIAASYENKIAVWGLDGRLIKTLEVPTDHVHTILFGHHGELIAAFYDTIFFWDSSYRFVKSMNGRWSDLHKVAFSPDGKYWLMGLGQMKRIWNMHTNPVGTIDSQPSYFSANGVYSVYLEDNGIKVTRPWDLQWQARMFLKFGDMIRPEKMSISNDGKYVATINGYQLEVWNSKGKLFKNNHAGISPFPGIQSSGEALATSLTMSCPLEIQGGFKNKRPYYYTQARSDSVLTAILCRELHGRYHFLGLWR